MSSPVLFLTNSELGQASVCLAVAHELLLQPSYTVHIASFAPLRDAVSELSLFFLPAPRPFEQPPSTSSVVSR